MVCPHWLSGILYNPVRKAFVDREAVLRRSLIHPGSVVIEIGPGNGFFTEVLAGRARFTYAIELQEKMVAKLLRRIRNHGQSVTVIPADIAVYKPADETADVGFLYYAFHEITNRESASKNIVRSIKVNGVVALFEPTIEVSRRSMDNTIALFERAGMRLEQRTDGVLTRFALLRKIQRSPVVE